LIKRLCLLAVTSLLLLYFVSPVSAQSPLDGDPPKVEWREVDTEHFIIVYAERIQGSSIFTCRCGADEARFYADFIDDTYDDLVGIFDTELETPINLRLFPTEESYFQVNPLARQITGVVAHALNNRAEIAIALPRTERLTEEEVANNVRHELSHFFASLLSDGNLNAGFQEGIAQYLEQPTEFAEYDPKILQQALDQGRLLSWGELDQPGRIWLDPQVAYPQALSMTAFLIDRYGFPRYVDFLAAHATEPGYRSAMQATYGKSADELEAEWLAYLPEYLAGRWQINAIYAYDLSRVTGLVEQGAYSDAEAELLEVIQLLEDTGQTDTIIEAERLLTQANQGRSAGMLAEEARSALQENDYPLTIDKANQAIALYEELGYRDRILELQVYIQRAEFGQDALTQLEKGRQMFSLLRVFEAESEIRAATVMLQSLNNDAAAAQGVALLNQIALQRSLLAYGMLLVGGLLLGANTIHRMFRRLTARPLELEYT
jgi:hypothetical protein